jgi:hypothetical protein
MYFSRSMASILRSDKVPRRATRRSGLNGRAHTAVSALLVQPMSMPTADGHAVTVFVDPYDRAGELDTGAECRRERLRQHVVASLDALHSGATVDGLGGQSGCCVHSIGPTFLGEEPVQPCLRCALSAHVVAECRAVECDGGGKSAGPARVEDVAQLLEPGQEVAGARW